MKLLLILFALVALCAATDHFDGDVEIVGTLKAVNQSLGYGLQVGTADAFNRNELWFYATNDADPANAGGTYSGDGGVLHLGANQADGFPVNVISEGITIWGMSEFGGAMNNANFSLCRMKPDRFQIRQSVNSVQADIFRVDPTKLVFRDKFEVTSDKTTVSNLAVLEGNGTHVAKVPKDDTPVHLTDYSRGRIAIVIDGETVYIPYF